jgi:hypothetical protein
MKYGFQLNYGGLFLLVQSLPLMAPTLVLVHGNSNRKPHS